MNKQIENFSDQSRLQGEYLDRKDRKMEEDNMNKTCSTQCKYEETYRILVEMPERKRSFGRP
jgi:hypothetical protein